MEKISQTENIIHSSVSHCLTFYNSWFPWWFPWWWIGDVSTRPSDGPMAENPARRWKCQVCARFLACFWPKMNRLDALARCSEFMGCWCGSPRQSRHEDKMRALDTANPGILFHCLRQSSIFRMFFKLQNLHMFLPARSPASSSLAKVAESGFAYTVTQSLHLSYLFDNDNKSQQRKRQAL